MTANDGSRDGGILGRLALVLALTLPAFGVFCGSALAYTFNEPSVKQIGPEEVVFDARDDETDPECGAPNDPSNPDNAGIPLACLKDACTAEDIPDNQARAFRGGDGTGIRMFASHFNILRFIGPDFNSLDHPCASVMPTGSSTDPQAFNDKEWLNAVYAVGPTTVYALIHEEYQGWRDGYPGSEACPPPFGVQQGCWRNSITFASSTDGGATFTSTSPGTIVAASPYQYAPGIGPYGYFNPTNIVLHTDGYYYAMMRTLGTTLTPAHDDGTCIMRTNNLSLPSSWRGWGDGDQDGALEFDVQFVNPYPTEPANKAAHVCRTVDPDLRTMTGDLVYSKYLGKYLLVDRLAGSRTPGVYYSTSDNLLSWSEPKLLMEAEVLPLSTADCAPPHPVRLPSLIDHSSGLQNFDTIGQRAHLYFTRSNMYESFGSCSQTHNRDLVRIPIEFSETAAPPPPPAGGADGGGSSGGDPAPPADTSAASLVLTSSKRQDIDKLSITIRLNENATVVTNATVNVPGASRVYKFKRVRRDIAANKRVKLRLKLAKTSLRKAKRALKRRKKLTAKVTVTATDGAGNKSVKRSSIRLKR